VVVPEAIRYGMPLNEFWYGDVRLLLAYKKSYLRDTSYKAWLQGRYDYEAYSIALSNAFAKKGTTPIKFPDWADPVEKLEKMYIKQESYEVQHHKQQMWFFDMINN
jgi:hypothetical protein